MTTVLEHVKEILDDLNPKIKSESVPNALTIEFLEDVSNGDRNFVVIEAGIELIQFQDPDYVKVIARARVLTRLRGVGEIKWHASLWKAAMQTSGHTSEEIIRNTYHLFNELRIFCKNPIENESVLGPHQEMERARTIEYPIGAKE